MGTYIYKTTNNNINTIDVILDWTPNTNHTGLYVAQELGYFKEAGLNVNIIQPPEDSATMLVGAGKAEFCFGFQDSLAIALTSNTPVPVTAVAAILQHNTSGIICHKDSGITTPRTLENKNIATWNSPIEQAILEDLVRQDGGNFQNVQIVPTSITDVSAAFNMGIDAMSVYYGWDGIAAEFIGIKTEFLPFASFNSDLDFYAPLILANNTYIQNHPDNTKAFLSALKRGYIFAANNPQPAAEILCKRAGAIDKEFALMSQSWVSKQYISDSQDWGIIDKNRWNSFYDWLFEKQLISKDIHDIGFSNQFLE